jgi:hypothetical protein
MQCLISVSLPAGKLLNADLLGRCQQAFRTFFLLTMSGCVDGITGAGQTLWT